MENRVIKMYYELKDAKSGEILESNFNANPIAFISGKEQIIQKLEYEVLKLAEGENKIIKISPADGAGEYNENAIQILPKEEFAGIDLVVGMELFGQAEDGATTRVIVKAVGEDDVTIDFNHPFAGKELEFNVKVVENREPTVDELMTGVPESEHTCECGGHGHHHHGEDHECCGGHGHGHKHGEHKCCGGHGHHHHED